MKTRSGVRLYPALAALALGLSSVSLPAQEQPPVVVAPADESPIRTPDQLEQLLGPIALYPDALIALILPASTAPVDIVLAARYLKDGGDANGTGARAWDESVKSLTHYPDVVKWMDENIEWTKQLGDAFLRQPADVMKAVQRLRERASAAGTLTTTPQQVVGYDAGVITIVPAEPNIIYVPRYEPEIVYVSQPVYHAQPFLTFGVGFAVGPWLTHDCDWRAHRVWIVDRHWNWRDHRDWRHPVFPGQVGYVNDPHRQPWRPSLNSGPTPVVWRREIQRPTPIVGTPTYTSTQPSATQPNGPAVSRRERTNTPPANRPVNVATTTAPAATTPPAAVGASPWVPVTQTMAAEANEQRNRRVRPVTPGTNRPNAATPTPATSTILEQANPVTNPPTTPVVGPITRPVVPQTTRPVVTPMPAYTAPATTTPQPQHTYTPPQHSAPARATTPPAQPPQSTAPARATPPAQQPSQPQQQTQAQPAPRDDKDNRRREQP